MSHSWQTKEMPPWGCGKHKSPCAIVMTVPAALRGSQPPVGRDSVELRGMDTSTLRTPKQLLEAGMIDAGDLEGITQVAGQFAVGISRQMRALINGAAPNDPIAAQFIPSTQELHRTAEELIDPIGDEAHSPTTGLVHRYPDRVLLKLTSGCPVYCRFCFRRETVGKSSGALNELEIEQALLYIESNAKIWEVVLSGGDPLILSQRRLQAIMRRLDAIGHIGVIRFHTRVPVVRPETIDTGLIDALKISKAVYVVLHTNHAQELSPAARSACARLIDSGFPMLGQTVLLKGVNSDAQTLTALFRALVAMRIKPYYLHHGDLARGTSHFRTSIEEGQALMAQLRGTVSGLCQPTYVLDIPGGHGKVPIGPNYISRSDAGKLTVTDIRGQSHSYPST
jgi:lysine 2,3-aminomutase